MRQEDAGYRLARVKNLGAQAAGGDFLAMIDGDSIPRRGFVEATAKSASPGWFVGGKRLELDARLSRPRPRGAPARPRLVTGALAP